MAYSYDCTNPSATIKYIADNGAPDVIFVKDLSFIGAIRDYYVGVIVYTGPEESASSAFDAGADDFWCGNTEVEGKRLRRLIQLNKTSRRYSAALQAIPDLIIHSDEFGNCIEVYKSDHFTTSVDVEKYKGANLNEVLPSDVVEVITTSIKKAVNLNIPVEFNYVCNGKYRECNVVPINHGMREALVMIQDVTEKHTLKAQLEGLYSSIDAWNQVEKISRTISEALTSVGKVGLGRTAQQT